MSQGGAFGLGMAWLFKIEHLVSTRAERSGTTDKPVLMNRYQFVSARNSVKTPGISN